MTIKNVVVISPSGDELVIAQSSRFTKRNLLINIRDAGQRILVFTSWKIN